MARWPGVSACARPCPRLMVAGLMTYQSVERLIAPSPIHYDQAIAIAIVGLIVNLVSAGLLKDGHHHHA